jgi:hypothetical protein
VQVRVGCDPELFLFSKSRNMYISAEGLVPGTKEDPHPLKDGAVQRDGTALEFNTTPCTSAGEFEDKINSVKEQCQALVGSDIELRAVPFISFDKDYYASLSEDSKRLGCEPDYMGWIGVANKRPKSIPFSHTGGGHLHTGWTNGLGPFEMYHFSDCTRLAGLQDTYFSLFVKNWDKDTRRHEMYGKGAAFRPKDYGVELRSLSNAWVGEPKLYRWLFDSCKWVFNALNEHDYQYYQVTSALRARAEEDVDAQIHAIFQRDDYPRYPA